MSNERDLLEKHIRQLSAGFDYDTAMLSLICVMVDLMVDQSPSRDMQALQMLYQDLQGAVNSRLHAAIEERWGDAETTV